MYHIIKQTIRQFLGETQVPDCVRWLEKGREDVGGGVLILFAVSVLPPSFNSPNDVCSNPAGLSSWAWIREYSRSPLKGSRKRLPLVNKQSSKPLLAGG